MVESARAAQAWADYLALGPERSLEKLLTLYQSGTKAAPTSRLSTLKHWSRTFGWQGRLEEIARKDAEAVAEREAAARAAIQAEGIANRQFRVEQLSDQWQRLRRTIEARAADPALADIPGGREGVLVAEPMLVKIYEAKPTPAGEELTPTKQVAVLYKYSVDVGTLKEMRDTMKQAAQDLGQWTEKQATEVTGKDGSPLLPVVEKKVPDADALALLAAQVFGMGRIDSGDAPSHGNRESLDSAQPDTEAVAIPGVDG